MKIGSTLPTLSFETTKGPTNFASNRGKWLVLYFYPKDATPGCTTEGCNFRDNYSQFNDLNTVIFGLSRDSLASHAKFKTKQGFPFELISDSDEAICQLFDVIKMKSMYGKPVRGIERSTLIADPNGVIRHVWTKVRVEGHVDEVLIKLRELQAASL
jgi:peroxiredoxin Q/BCP